MPVSANNMRKCPTDSVSAQASGDLGIFVDVVRIVEINEGKPDCLAEHKPSDCDEKEAKPNSHSERSRGIAWCNLQGLIAGCLDFARHDGCYSDGCAFLRLKSR